MEKTAHSYARAASNEKGSKSIKEQFGKIKNKPKK